MRKLSFSRVVGIGLVTVLFYGPANAATLVLNDGAVIHGEIQSLQGDVYTVKTTALGTVKVRKQNIRTIDHSVGGTKDGALGASPKASPGVAASPSKAAVQGVQSQLTQRPDLLSLIQALQNDPEVQAVLTDPEIMSAISAGDYGPLMEHPKIIALTQNSKVREVINAAK